MHSHRHRFLGGVHPKHKSRKRTHGQVFYWNTKSIKENKRPCSNHRQSSTRHFHGGLFLLPSFLYLLLHHLISFICSSPALHPHIHLLSHFSSRCSHTKPLFSVHTCPPHFLSNSFIPPFLAAWARLWSISHHIAYFLCSTYLPVCSCLLPVCASASIESPSVPIHHALHFSLLAGINHKYFIIHHGRLSPAHRQFITAALSAGLPRRL